MSEWPITNVPILRSLESLCSEGSLEERQKVVDCDGKMVRCGKNIWELCDETKNKTKNGE